MVQASESDIGYCLSVAVDNTFATRLLVHGLQGKIPQQAQLSQWLIVNGLMLICCNVVRFVIEARAATTPMLGMPLSASFLEALHGFVLMASRGPETQRVAIDALLPMSARAYGEASSDFTVSTPIAGC